MLKDEISAAFLPQFLAGYRAQGFDAEALLAECGLPTELLCRPQARLSFSQFGELHKMVATRMRDETMGLLGTPQSLGTFELLARVLLQCETIAEAGAELADLCNRRPHGLNHTFKTKRTGVEFAVEILPGSSVLNEYAIDSTLLHSYRHLCWLCVERIAILSVDLPFPPPPWQDQYSRMYPGARIRFNTRHAALLLDKVCLGYPVVQKRSELSSFLSNAFGIMPKPEERLGPRSQRVKKAIESSLIEEHVVPEFSEVSHTLGEAVHTLRRRLTQEGMTYKELLAMTRRSLAIRMLQGSDLKIEVIALQLGYVDASSFVRAFKCWEGTTPAAYRKNFDEL
jgi:AraC-like DNA-binding protein